MMVGHAWRWTGKMGSIVPNFRATLKDILVARIKNTKTYKTVIAGEANKRSF